MLKMPTLMNIVNNNKTDHKYTVYSCLGLSLSKVVINIHVYLSSLLKVISTALVLVELNSFRRMERICCGSTFLDVTLLI